MSDTMGLTTRPMGFTIPLGPGPTRRQRDKAGAERLGIELPFGWCLIKGQTLRQLQSNLREAQQTAALRLRICANLQKELLRKESR